MASGRLWTVRPWLWAGAPFAPSALVRFLDRGAGALFGPGPLGFGPPLDRGPGAGPWGSGPPVERRPGASNSSGKELLSLGLFLERSPRPSDCLGRGALSFGQGPQGASALEGAAGALDSLWIAGPGIWTGAPRLWTSFGLRARALGT